MPEKLKPKVLYTAHFVSDNKKLIERIPPAVFGEDDRHYDDVFHVTKEFMPTTGIDEIEVGKKRTLQAIGQVVLDGVHAVLVKSPNGEGISKNENPHITIVTAKGVKPQESNDVLKKAIKEGLLVSIEPPIEIETIEGYHDGEKIHVSTD